VLAREVEDRLERRMAEFSLTSTRGGRGGRKNVEAGAMRALHFQLAGFFPPPDDVLQGAGAAAPRA
jgi:hypothetical protein